MITDWLEKGMPEGMEARVFRLCELRRGFIEQMLARAQGLEEEAPQG